MVAPRAGRYAGPVEIPSSLTTTLRDALGLSAPKPQDLGPILSGSPAQIIQSIFNQAFTLRQPGLIQLVLEESNSGRTFMWQSELQKEGYSVVNSEEFDHSSADPYLQVIPNGDWILQILDAKKPLRVYDAHGKKQPFATELPDALLQSFKNYKVVMSVIVNLGDEW